MRRFWLASVLIAAAVPMWAQDDPPSRVARLNLVEGSVSFQPAGRDEWSAATINYPLTTGDHLWADEQSRAEMHIGSTSIRLDAHTALAFLNLDDRMTQMRLSDGTVNISIRRLDNDESYEVDTPNGAVTLLRPGRYRIDADPDRQVATVTVRSGEAEVTSGGQAFPVHPRQSAFITGEEAPVTEVREASMTDDFDHWWQDRDDREDRRPPPRYVSRDMVGYQDLDDNGDWRDYPEYGHVWVPRVSVGWAPYRFGHWAWVDPWGWTWIDDASWGFAPFHYGRWANAEGGWCWIPGPIVARPVYAPALVVFLGGSHFGASLSFGGGAGVGWFPLGPREVYRPAYRVSETYVTRVNVTNVTNINVTNITNVNNVTNVRYVNQNVPGAVTAVSHTDFISSRPVARAAVVVPPSTVASAQVVGAAPPITRAQAISAPRPNVAVARPPQAALTAPVVTKTPPPAATAIMARPPNAPYRAPAANQPALFNRPGQPQAQQPVSPSYRPPPAQAQPQGQPQYRPPVQQTQPQAQPPYRPPTPQAQPQAQPPYRPPAESRPAPQYRPAQPPPPYRQPQAEQQQSAPHNHGAPPPPPRPAPQQERRPPPPPQQRPEKSDRPK